MKNLVLHFSMGILCLGVTTAIAQNTDSTKKIYGVRQSWGGAVVVQSVHPEVRGLVGNFKWKDIEPSNNVWNWQQLDSDMMSYEDGLPFQLMIFTKENAPGWLFTSGGVPKVIEYNTSNDSVGFSPYYADSDYKFYFKRMIDTVANHVKAFPDRMKKYLSIQACLGEEQDYIGYRNIDGSRSMGLDTQSVHVDPRYDLNATELSALFKEFTWHYYSQYVGSGIGILCNPSCSNIKTQSNIQWVFDSLPGTNLRYAVPGKSYQINDELDKMPWLIPVLNSKHNGAYTRANSDLANNDVKCGWWYMHSPRNMFTLFTSMLYYGLELTDQMPTFIKDPVFTPAFDFFNKYAGEKDTSTATHAMCALRDGLDASDPIRFPSAIYGKILRSYVPRYMNIQNEFASKGALLMDTFRATVKENLTAGATGINDVGWRILPGNYERYIHQINANNTSAGYWNVDAPNDTNSIYGRFARGFDLANGKDGLYFNVDDGFLNNAPLNSQYPVMVSITYLDKGHGSWKLFYDAEDSNNKSSVEVNCANSGRWKNVSITLEDAYFGNRSISGSDFYIKSTDTENVIFALVELQRPNADGSDVGLSASDLVAFDTLCVNSISTAKSFILTGAFLNGSDVTIGPFEGFKFSFLADSAYDDSLTISNYGVAFSDTIYVKLTPIADASYDGNVLITGGGANFVKVKVSGVAVNSSPVLSAVITNISCNGLRDGAINLTTTGGIRPFTFSWVNGLNFKDSAQDISGLAPENYTVTVASYAGCRTSASYVVTEPGKLIVNLSANSMVCRGGTTIVHVTATGGTPPYNGTGNFTVSSGWKTFTVIDAHGCSSTQSITVTNGTGVAPIKPGTISGASADATGLCGGGNFSYAIDPVATALSYTWTPPAGCSIRSASTDSTQITLNVPAGFTTGTLSVAANNACGVSAAQIKNLSAIPVKPGTVSGPTLVQPLQTGVAYSVPAVNGLTYTWAVPRGAKIVAGQNTPAITANWGSEAGNVIAKAVNACGSSSGSVLAVAIAGSTLASSVSSLPSFDTLCINGLSVSQSFTLSGSGLSGTRVVVGPFAGYKISSANSGPYRDSLIINNYGTSFMQSVYVKFSPTSAALYKGHIPISGGGGYPINVAVRGVAVNSSPALSATITNVSCSGAKNGAIDLKTNGGMPPFTYLWNGPGEYDSTAQDISGLSPATYTVTVNSYAGCETSASYLITQPNGLILNLSADKMLCRGGTTTVHVTATGGTAPYNGTGNFIVSSGQQTFTVTDAHGCSTTKSISVPNGTGVAPDKPGTISSPIADATGLCGGGNFDYAIDPVATASSYKWTAPAKSTIGSVNSDGTQVTLNVLAGFTTGTLSVTANNTCGSSAAQTKVLNAIPAKPGAISGPSSVSSLQTGLVYAVPAVTGITYTWNVPGGATITRGQNTASITVNWGTKPGNVTVMATNACGGSSNSILSVTIGASSAAQPRSFSSMAENILVLPNPARDIAYLSFISGDAYKYAVILTDMAGKTLALKDGIALKGENKLSIDMHNYTNGTYIVTFINYRGDKTRIKLLKEK